MSALLIGRGDPTAGDPSALLVLGVCVTAFWVLVGAIFFALWFARRRKAARPEAEAHAENDHRAHLSFVESLRLSHERRSPAIMRGPDGRVILYPELSGKARAAGRRRRHGRRRID